MVSKNFQYKSRKKRKNQKRKFNEQKKKKGNSDNGVFKYIIIFGFFVLSMKALEYFL